MTKFELYCDFIAAKNKANQLEYQAKQIKRMANNSIRNDLQRLDKNWDGEASRRYIAKGNQLITKADNIAQSLITTAQTIRTVAERIYRTELRALEIAKTRKRK